MRLISLEGNIGSGKTTLLAELKKKAPAIVLVDEPVSEWLDIQGVNMIERFYGDKKRNSFLFQVMAFVTRMEKLETAIAANPEGVLVTERCLSTDELFASMLHDDGLMDDVEYDVYKRLAKRFVHIRPDVTIYLQCAPELSFQRCQARGREGEVIAIDYLQKCHAKHEEWAAILKPVIFDAAAPLLENILRFCKLV